MIIYLATYNRKTVTNFVLDNLNAYKKDAKLFITDDCSFEYDSKFLENKCDYLNINTTNKGIFSIRKEQLLHFYNSDKDFAYFTDNDTIHDENFIDTLFLMYAQYPNKLLSLYNTKFHDIHSIIDDTYIIKENVTGNSLFMDRTIIETVIGTKEFMMLNDNAGWDWKISKIFKQCVVTKKKLL